MSYGRIDREMDRLIEPQYDSQFTPQATGTGASQNEGRLFSSYARTENQNGLFHTHKFNPKMLCRGRGLTVGRNTKRNKRAD